MEVRCSAKHDKCWTLIVVVLSDRTVVESGSEKVLGRLDDESEHVSIGPGCKYHRNSYRDRTGRVWSTREQRIYAHRLAEAYSRALMSGRTEQIGWVPWDL